MLVSQIKGTKNAQSPYCCAQKMATVHFYLFVIKHVLNMHLKLYDDYRDATCSLRSHNEGLLDVGCL